MTGKYLVKQTRQIKNCRLINFQSWPIIDYLKSLKFTSHFSAGTVPWTNVILEYIVTQLLTATTAVEGEANKHSLLRGHNDKVAVHQLRAVGLISSSGVCESVVSYH